MDRYDVSVLTACLLSSVPQYKSVNNEDYYTCYSHPQYDPIADEDEDEIAEDVHCESQDHPCATAPEWELI